MTTGSAWRRFAVAVALGGSVAPVAAAPVWSSPQDPTGVFETAGYEGLEGNYPTSPSSSAAMSSPLASKSPA